MANQTHNMENGGFFKGIDQARANEKQAQFDRQSPAFQKILNQSIQETSMILRGHPATDLPPSPLIDNGQIPKRVIEQFINYTTIAWPMLNDFTFEQMMNGSFDITYRNTIKGDTTSAMSDVEIADFNGKELPSARLTWTAAKEYHFKLKIPFAMLNQVFINQGSWSVFFDDFAWAQGRDLGAQRLIQYLTTIDGLVATTATVGKVVPILLDIDSTKTDEEQTKQAYTTFIKEILNLATPSSDHVLDPTIEGKFTDPIINSWTPSELLIYVDYKYYADLKAYLYAGAYNLNDAKIIDLIMKPINLTALTKTLGITLPNLIDKVCIVMSKGKGNEKPLYGQFFQFTAMKMVDTPKAYDIMHFYQYWDDFVNPQGHLSVYKLNIVTPTTTKLKLQKVTPTKKASPKVKKVEEKPIASTNPL